jgi:hypothetical protein
VLSFVWRGAPHLFIPAVEGDLAVLTAVCKEGVQAANKETLLRWRRLVTIRAVGGELQKGLGIGNGQRIQPWRRQQTRVRWRPDMRGKRFTVDRKANNLLWLVKSCLVYTPHLQKLKVSRRTSQRH